MLIHYYYKKSNPLNMIKLIYTYIIKYACKYKHVFYEIRLFENVKNVNFLILFVDIIKEG